MDVSLSSGIDLSTAINVHSTGPLGLPLKTSPALVYGYFL
jgi:hypothetical protein